MTTPGTVVYIATSLDGFIARPDGSIDWLGEPEGTEDYGWTEFIAGVDHIVMGRVTFETVLSLGTWPYVNTPMTVLSTTLETVPDELADKVDVLAAEPGAVLEALGERGRTRVYVDGGRTIQGFLRFDLIDEMVITRLPILIGGGVPLFGPLEHDIPWELSSTETFAKGLVKSTYLRKR